MHKILNNKKQKGSLLIELMIGLLMSLFTIMVVMKIFANFEGQKRTTESMSSTISMGAMALFPIEHYGQMAGYGFNNSSLMGCNVLAYNNNSGSSFNFTMSPVIIQSSGNNTTSDQITFLEGNAYNSFNTVQLTQSMPSSSSDLKVTDRFGFQEGDLIIVAQPGSDCSLMQVSNLPGTNGQTNNVIHNSGTYTDPTTGLQDPTIYNKPSGLGVAYSSNAYVFDLGQNPSEITYSVNANNQLVQNNTFNLTNPTSVVGDNIILLKAQYGLDPTHTGNVATWTNTITNTSDYANIIAVRVALIAQSPLLEKPINGTCSITQNSTFNWAGGTMDISTIPNWGCYRYRLLQTVIPLRNMLWMN